MIDKRIGYRFGGGYQGGATNQGGAGNPGNGGGNGGNAREERISQQYSSPAPAPARDERVSPIESMARVGDTSLAGKTREEADATMEAQNEAERTNKLSEARKLMTQKTGIQMPDARTPIEIGSIDPYQESHVLPNEIITEPLSRYDVRKKKDEIVENRRTNKFSEARKHLTDTTDYKELAERSMFNLGVGEIAKNLGIANYINPALTLANIANKFFGKRIDPYSTVKSKVSDLKSKFASTKKPNIDTKTGIQTAASGDGRQIEQPIFQQAISKGEGLKSGEKLLGLTEEEINYFNKLFASRDREFLQNALDQGTIRIQSGKATQKEKDVHALLQEYLIDPKTGIMEVA